MAVLSIILLVLFVLVSLFLIFVVSIQSEDNSGLGGIFGGSSDSAFGGRSNRVMNKITAYTVAAFIILAIAVAFVNKSSDSSVLSSLKESAAATSTEKN
ncbi:MAG: preprotein translocase subunit SecG [Spirochaetales bacterium]|nr:preprotein translocase subunit SecG [Spirochaetales bacterium]MBO6048169.1 preprotein translocase subunit SecG [Spirochaetales bacterium]MBO7349299.1 preprotein translocase subunit SecG [Spirochaetales bacterium]MBP5756705.1 preprotein translocase subunit SecG [Spirochaetales bacterium]